jgi:DMSO/TMAO reductase YedYZ molybdopterin-dependent catalytic subunit
MSETNSASEPVNRRSFLQRIAAGAALFMAGPGLASLLAACAREAERAAVTATATGGPAPGAMVKAPLILRSSRPLDLETPVHLLGHYLTPNEAFFVRTHHDEPRLDAGTWRLNVEGLVNKRLTLTLDDLKALLRHEVTAVLQCSGNGRAYFQPRVPGVPWEKGAVGNARWAGARLADVLAKAGLKPGGLHVVLQGADQPLLPATPRFGRSIPISKALHPDTIVAYEMNGAPLPSEARDAAIEERDEARRWWLKWYYQDWKSEAKSRGWDCFKTKEETP